MANEKRTLVIRCSLSIESSIQVICLVQSSNDSNSRSIALTCQQNSIFAQQVLTEVAKEPVLQTVITFNPFFPPPLFCHNHSAPFFPISIHLSKSSPWTALHPSLTFSLISSPDAEDFSPSDKICRILLSASERFTAVGRDD
jgi:hypothetical protein